MYWSSFDWTTYRLVIAPVSFIKGEGSLLAGSLFMNLFEFLTTRFANWMNKSNSDFNSLWIDRICYNVHLHEIVKSRKTAKKSLPTFPTYGVSWQLTILHCSKISRSNFENFQLSISLKISMSTCPSKFLTTNPTGCFSNK
jgi:hypothetical protein